MDRRGSGDRDTRSLNGPSSHSISFQLMQIRAFCNHDPPALVQLWRRLGPLRARAQTLNIATLERLILSKPYFDREGLLIAHNNDREYLGFVHAAFGSQSDGSGLDHEIGVISTLVVPDGDGSEVAARLLTCAEQYLQSHGSRQIIAGGVSPHHPFYLGLYGGALLPGIVNSDPQTLEHFSSAGYQPQGERLILQRSLVGFRPPIDRDLMQVRRSCHIEITTPPVDKQWWDACTLGLLNRERFYLSIRGHQDHTQWIDIWDVEPLSSEWGVHAMGICQWHDNPENGQPIERVFFLGEIMRILAAQGISLLETQIPSDELSQSQILQRLGFEEADRGIVLIKSLE